jgi:hypothetical protein
VGRALLAVAVFALLSFVGPVARPFAALLGGVGFGLFIDEVGKFVSSDTDYFYRPGVVFGGPARLLGWGRLAGARDWSGSTARSTPFSGWHCPARATSAWITAGTM